MSAKKDKKTFWDTITTYNSLMKISIEGPNCTDPTVCLGDCCDIQINVPKILAKKYIKEGYATKNDFIRSNVYSFKLGFNYLTAKCVLFDQNKNGCSVHHSNIKPPECWIYPTGFSPPKETPIRCKKVGGWNIKKVRTLIKAEELYEIYKEFCLLEAKSELENIKNRVINSKRKDLKKTFQEIKPSHLAGFQDSWDTIEPLYAEGYSLFLKRLCKKYNPSCPYIPHNFVQCEQICTSIANELISFLECYLQSYCKQKGCDSSGKYPFHRLFKDITTSEY
ncbi:MAG: hypothetical protein BAJALOKI1v1_10001 [Promethearchaeota archaeon]|nr:MAG: hypothetical protein BAJALOKI1v1_10001 [Candidatus Lokiarchaeota archaeon]